MKKLIILLFALLVCSQIHAQKGDYAEVNGVKIYYEVYGEGEPLVLLHGFMMNRTIWEGWIEELSDDYQLILPDLRGHGNSTNPSNKFTHKEAAKDMYGLLDMLGISGFNAMGFSSGAMTLIHMAVMDTSRVKAMVLIGSSSFYPESCRERMRSTSFEKASANERWMNNLKRWNPQGEEQVRNILTQFRDMADSYDDMNFTGPYLSTIKCPTLIIHGDRDSYFPIDIPVNLYKSIPNSYLWIIPNFWHKTIYPNSIWADPFMIIMDEFLLGEWERY